MSRCRSLAALPLAALLLATLQVAGLPAPIRAQEPAVSARAFKIHHRPLADAADLVGEVLSEQGSVTLKPRLGTLVVEDRPAVLKKVADLLASFDLPPRRVDVTLSLFLGSREKQPDGETAPRHPGDAFSREVNGIMESLSDFTKWTAYRPLGSRSVSGLEGEPVLADLAPEYRVAFRVGAVEDTRRTVKFDRFTLQRVTRPADSGEPRVDDLYTAAMVVDSGKLTLVVAASAPDSPQALFLALQADPR